MKVDIKTNYKQVYHDFDILKGCFGGSKIMPTDVDCVIERNRKFLFIEFKPDKQQVPVGQGILLTRLSKVKDMTVVVVWHKYCEQHSTKVPVAMQELPNGELLLINTGDFREYVSNWYEKANQS